MLLEPINRLLPVSFYEKAESALLERPVLARRFLKWINPLLLEGISEKKAIAEFNKAISSVPAYISFLKKEGVAVSSIYNIIQFKTKPITTKDNYVRKYSYEKRCVGSKLPSSGTICESSGSTGKPTNWVHSLDEENMLFKLARFEFDYLYGLKKNFVVINAWLTGAWSTGIKFAEITERCALVKNTSMDKEKIIQTLQAFGTGHHYLIAGYPPFLQQLFDDRSIRWKDYKIDVLTGCESTIPEWKRLIAGKLHKNATIVSAYGASDLDIGIGVETRFTDFIRSLLVRNKNLRKSLFPDASCPDEIPMAFQYNPLLYYIENVQSKNHQNKEVTELCFSLLDPKAVAPKIRYNLKDEGRKVGYKEMLDMLKRFYPSQLKERLKKDKPLHLPFLFIFGRTDGTISVVGSNIYPDQVERAIAYNPRLLNLVNRFMLYIKYEKKSKLPRFHIDIELTKGAVPSAKIRKLFARQIKDKLGEMNGDYKILIKTNPVSSTPIVCLFRFESPEFSKYDLRIKQKYIK